MLRLGPFVVATISLLILSGCANRPPTLNCAVEPSVITEGDSATVQTNAVDPERKPLSFEWEAEEGKLAPENGSAVFDSTDLDPGQYRISAEVRDQKNTVDCSVMLTVEKRKLAPEIKCESVRVSVTEGQSVTLKSQGSDPNQDALTYSWLIDRSEVPNDQPTFSFGTAGRSVGAHTATVTVTDVDGMTADCTFTVTIEPRPNPPLSLTLSIDKDEVYAGETVTVIAKATDPDNDPLTFKWKVNGQSRAETVPTLKIQTQGLTGGSHSVAVTVADDRGDSKSASQTFKIREEMVIQMDSARPDNVAKARLDEVAVRMQQNPQLRALITGHTDDRGREASNVKYGQKRADAVKKCLVEENQIDESRIKTESAGESQPTADNSTAEGRKENRRVEIDLYVP